MASYISSNNERFYAAVEAEFGQAAEVTAQNRFPAVRFSARQQTEQRTRRDKTGSRTFRGLPPNPQRQTNFDLATYMTGWNSQPAPPAYGALFQGAMGSAPQLFAGGNAAAGSAATSVTFAGAHGLSVGQAITYSGEIRFIAAIPNTTSVVVNEAFATAPAVGSPIGATVSYRPANDLPSLSIYDYWSPETAVQRFLNGAVVNRMKLAINGDFHEFEFSGTAKDLVDNASFSEGVAGLSAYPAEPPLADYEYSIIPGNLGQAWLGSSSTKFCTLTTAELVVENGVELRNNEFGCGCARVAIPGERRVTLQFSLYEQDDEATRALYQAARQQSPISVMFQLGYQQGQLFGVWMTGVVPEVPEFDDSDTRLQWRFGGSRAQGTVDDEIFVAFG